MVLIFSADQHQVKYNILDLLVSVFLSFTIFPLVPPAEVHSLELLVNVFLQLREFYRRALLATNALSPVNPEERQKARTLHFAKFVQPRPMYFGHYQNLIYNQSVWRSDTTSR